MSRRAQLDALWPGCGLLLLDALAHERDRAQRWWSFRQWVRGLGDLPPGAAASAVLALLQEGIDGCPLEDRQVEDLAHALERLALTDALRQGLPVVPEFGAGHGIEAWRAAAGRPARRRTPPPDRRRAEGRVA